MRAAGQHSKVADEHKDSAAGILRSTALRSELRRAARERDNEEEGEGSCGSDIARLDNRIFVGHMPVTPLIFDPTSLSRSQSRRARRKFRKSRIAGDRHGRLLRNEWRPFFARRNAFE